MSEGMKLAENVLSVHEAAVTIKRENIGIDNVMQKITEYFPLPAIIFAWQTYSAGFAKWTGDEWITPKGREIEIEYLNEIRIFDTNAELRMVRYKEGFKGRYILDEGTEKTMYADAFARLFGKCYGVQDGFSILIDEGRQTAHYAPIEAAKNQHIGLITRNYIEEVGDMGQLSYTDWRFVALEIAQWEG